MIRRILFLGLALGLAALVYVFAWWQPIINFLQPQNLQAFIQSFGWWAPFVFMALYYTLTLAFISAAVFTVLAGVLFGKIWGTIYVVVAATLAAQTAFFIARNLGQQKVDQLKQKKSIGPLLKTVETRCQNQGFKSLFILRCLFLPYMPLSYAGGLIKSLSARDFFMATLLTNAIFSPAFVWFGDSLLAGPKALILPIVMITLVLLVPKILKKISA